MQIFFFEPKIVADLVHNGDTNLFYKFFLGGTVLFEGFSINSDGVGEEPGVIKTALGECHAVVEAEDIGESSA